METQISTGTRYAGHHEPEARHQHQSFAEHPVPPGSGAKHHHSGFPNASSIGGPTIRAGTYGKGRCNLDWSTAHLAPTLLPLDLHSHVKATMQDAAFQGAIRAAGEHSWGSSVASLVAKTTSTQGDLD